MKQIMNTPQTIMRIPVKDGAITRDRDIKASALPMALAMQWTEDADNLSAALLSASTAKERCAAMELILDAVCTYGKDFPVEAIREQASAVQIMTAFEMLRELNDPLAVAREKQEAEQAKNMEILARLPQSMVQKLIEKHTPEILSASASASE